MTYVRNIHLLLLSLPIVLSAQNRIGTGKVADLYQMHCALCHGEELDGGLGGALIGPLDHARTDAEIAAWIRDGNTDLQMPSPNRRSAHSSSISVKNASRPSRRHRKPVWMRMSLMRQAATNSGSKRSPKASTRPGPLPSCPMGDFS